MSPVSPVYRSREIARPTCIRGFTGRQIIKSAVFDATTLSPLTLTPPAQYVNIWGAQGPPPMYLIPIGSFLTKSTTDSTKVKIYEALGTNQDDIQTITITGSPTGGTFTLEWGGHTTAPIVYNATDTQVGTAFGALPNVGPGNIQMGGGALPGTPVTIEFKALLGNSPQPAIIAHGAGLTGGTAPAVHITDSTPGTSAEKIIGVFDGPDRDLFGNGSVAMDEAIPIYFHSVAFDISKLQNWDLYGVAAEAALPTCSFY